MTEDGDELCVPFLLDGDGYTERERDMFVAGVEFCMVMSLVITSTKPASRRILRENEDRIRLLCSRFRRACDIETLDETWSQLEIGPGG